MTTHVQAQHSENMLKAVFITRFIKFSEWQNESVLFESKKKFYIYSLTQKEINKELKKTLSQIKLKGQEVEFKTGKSIDEAINANVIVVSEDCLHYIPSLVTATEGKPILLIGDSPNFGEQGVHINMFITPKGTISFELNMKSFEKSNIKPNSGLIRMGKIIK